MFVTISVIAALSFMSDHPFDQGSRESVLNSEFLSWQGMLQDSWQLPAALFLRTKKMQTLVSAQPGSYAVIERRPMTPGRGVFLLLSRSHGWVGVFSCDCDDPQQTKERGGRCWGDGGK